MEKHWFESGKSPAPRHFEAGGDNNRVADVKKQGSVGCRIKAWREIDERRRQLKEKPA